MAILGQQGLSSYWRSRNPIKLPGKRTQPQANHTEADQPAKIRDEPDDGEDQQAYQ
jgi:hypothetical protein